MSSQGAPKSTELLYGPYWAKKAEFTSLLSQKNPDIDVMNALFRDVVLLFNLTTEYDEIKHFKNLVDRFVELNCPNAIYFKAQLLMGKKQSPGSEDLFERDELEAKNLMSRIRSIPTVDKYDEGSFALSQSIRDVERLGEFEDPPEDERPDQGTLTRSILNTNTSSAVYRRGQSFIKAAELIIDHASLSVAQRNAAYASLNAIKIVWGQKYSAKLDIKDLGALESLIIEKLSRDVYQDERKFKDVKNELDNAENHINWKTRSQLKSAVGGDEQRGIVIRTETPITHFTPAQEEEWRRILDRDNQPQWFKALAQWEQNYFIKKIKQWDSTPDPKVNLGVYLGTVPTTIRRYPGAPNAYVTHATISGGQQDDLTFSKIRSGILVPVKMDAKKHKEQIVEITRQNLEQLIVQAISEKLSREPHGRFGELSFPILLQTLYSPPFQPEECKYANTALRKAVEQMRAILRDKEKLNDLLKANGIDTKYQINIDLLYSNRPVNNARGAAKILANLKKIGRANAKTKQSFQQYIENNKPPAKNLELARKAFQRFESMDKEINLFKALRLFAAGKFPVTHNPTSERAAYEQIVADNFGVRIGTCVSGKDREEMITEIALAQLEFYNKYREFPPPFDSKQPDDPKRIEFEEMVADLYLKGHGQKLAGENSIGCDGLKNVSDVFGSRICAKIKERAPKFGVNPEIFDPVKDVQRVAKLNKLKDKFLKSVRSSPIYKSLKSSVQNILGSTSPQTKVKKDTKSDMTFAFAHAKEDKKKQREEQRSENSQRKEAESPKKFNPLKL